MRAKKVKDREWLRRIPATPLGPLCLYFTAAGLTALEFGQGCPENPTDEDLPPPALRVLMEQTEKQLTAYFAGAATDFHSLPLDLKGTPFQVRVWQELQRIPRGKKISYRELASRVGRPRAFRAVGRANGANPLPIIIPCHRVINADGSLGGYSSGVDRKRWLLNLEGAF